MSFGQRGNVYVVIGAKGGTGAEIVKRLLERPATEVSEVRALVRDPGSVPPAKLPTDPRLSLLAGDASKAETLAGPFKGAKAVFFAAAGRTRQAIEDTDEAGVRKVAEAALAALVERVVLVSSAMVHPQNKWHPIRFILNNFITGFSAKRGLMDIKFAGENLLRASGQPYTIVRPGQLVDADLGWGTPAVGQCNASFMRGAKSSRADVAMVCVAAAAHPATKDVTFELASTPNKQVVLGGVKLNYDEMFQPLVAGWGETAGPPAARAEVGGK